MSDWRGKTMARIRKLVRVADKEIVEAVKYKTKSNPAGVFVWSKDGMIATGETYKEHLRLSFAKGPQLKDPKKLINSYRAILIREGDKFNDKAFVELIREAAELNHTKAVGPTRKKVIRKRN